MKILKLLALGVLGLAFTASAQAANVLETMKRDC